MPKLFQNGLVRDTGICPIDLRSANKFVKAHHSYLSYARGCLFCIAAYVGPRIVAIAIIGRPISPSNQDGVTAEITRLCTHEAPRNTATTLVRRAVTACRAIGYTRVITYVDATLPGTMWKASNFTVTAERSRTQWHSRDTCTTDNRSKRVRRWTFVTAEHDASATAARLREIPPDDLELELWSEVANRLPLRD